MNIKFKVTGIEELKTFLDKLETGVKIAAMRAVSYYLVGRENEALRKEPANKFVRRADAYGKVSDAPAGYFSMKQFRYVAWLTDGFTKKYDRTHAISQAWEYHETNSQWDRVNIQNNAPGAEYVVGDGQSRHEALVGWRKWRQAINDNMAGAVRYAQEMVDKYIKSAK
jgi:hypothetical protein